MGSQPNPTLRVSFGPFEFEQYSGDLRKFGSRIRLQGKPLQILSLLLDQPGQLLTRAELQRALWQGTTFVDFEQGLNTAVNKLRQALGDSASRPRYIETIPGKGYRFIAPLQRSSTKPVLTLVPPQEPPAAIVVTRRPTAWLPIAAVAALVLGTGVWLASGRQAPAIPKPARFSVTPPPGFVLEAGVSRQSFALSPDGTRIAFTAMDTSGAFSAFIRDFNSLELRLLPGSEGVHTIFWSPDSRSLFMTVKGKLQRAPLEGDARVVLGESPAFLLSGVWLSPDRLLLGAATTSYSVAPSGGTPHPLNQVYRWPQLLPDGQHILYVTTNPQTMTHRAQVARFDDPASAKDLIESDSRVQYTASLANSGKGYVMYVRDGNLLAQPFDPKSLRVTGEAIPVVSKLYSFRPTGAADFSVSNTGTLAYQSFSSRSQLAWVDRQGRKLGSVGPVDINVKSGRVSPDGRKLATAIYDIDRGAQNLWIVDLQSNAARELTLEPGVRDAPVWSPDSRTVGFLYSSGRSPQVHVRGTGENDPEEELGMSGFQMPTDWSPDGRFIVFENTGASALSSETQGNVLMIDLANPRKVIPILNSRFHEGNAAFSPDGKWLTFTSNESGRPEVYLQSFDPEGTPHVTGERHLVTRSGAQALRWRRDGKELFYLAMDGRVYAVPSRLTPKPEFGPALPLFTISTEARGAIHSALGFDVSPDGQKFLIPTVSSKEAPSLVIVQNWEAALPHSQPRE